MIGGKSVLAIIPARGGSKGLPQKNILPLGGKPLIVHTIQHAQHARYVDRIVVSTDCPTIRQIASHYGADVPFMRPAHLATDTATTESVLQHCLLEVEVHQQYDIVVLLECTAPFRRRGLIDDVLEELTKENVDTCLTVVRTHEYLWTVENGKPVRHDPVYFPRQVRPLRYRETGSVYASRAEVIRKGERIGDTVAFVEMDPDHALIDVHSSFDLWLANALLKNADFVHTLDYDPGDGMQPNGPLATGVGGS